MRCNTLAVEAILEGFALNARFSPQVLDESSIQKMIPELLDTIFHRG
jgi:pyruvate-formate lyase